MPFPLAYIPQDLFLPLVKLYLEEGALEYVFTHRLSIGLRLCSSVWLWDHRPQLRRHGGSGIHRVVCSEVGFPISILFPKLISCGYLYRNKFSCVGFIFKGMIQDP